MTIPTDLLARLRAVLTAAEKMTPGPWSTKIIMDGRRPVADVIFHDDDVDSTIAGVVEDHADFRANDARGIVALRNATTDLAALLALLAALPPACDCDGGLFGAGPGDHAIGCPARPVPRVPVAGWRETMPGLWHLDLGPFDATAETPARNAYRPATTWGAAGKRLGSIPGWQPVAAKLAAEDVAADLLRAGLAVLGRNA